MYDGSAPTGFRGAGALRAAWTDARRAPRPWLRVRSRPWLIPTQQWWIDEIQAAPQAAHRQPTTLRWPSAPTCDAEVTHLRSISHSRSALFSSSSDICDSPCYPDDSVQAQVGRLAGGRLTACGRAGIDPSRRVRSNCNWQAWGSSAACKRSSRETCRAQNTTPLIGLTD